MVMSLEWPLTQTVVHALSCCVNMSSAYSVVLLPVYAHSLLASGDMSAAHCIIHHSHC